jgi:hypothetical protein
MTTKAFVTRLAVLAVGAAGLLNAGCSTMNNTEKGALLGAGGGAIAGTLIDKATGGKGGAGALIGAAGGGILGGVIGNDSDKYEKRQADVRQATAEQAYQNDQPSRINQIVELTRTGQSEGVILNYIKNNRMTFRLTVDDLSTLKANNVSPRVVEAMQLSAQPVVMSAPKPVVVREVEYVDRPVIVRQPPPVVFVDPYQPPPGIHFHGQFR